jgi:hypothetical protein
MPAKTDVHIVYTNVKLPIALRDRIKPLLEPLGFRNVTEFIIDAVRLRLRELNCDLPAIPPSPDSQAETAALLKQRWQNGKTTLAQINEEMIEQSELSDHNQ